MVHSLPTTTLGHDSVVTCRARRWWLERSEVSPVGTAPCEGAPRCAPAVVDLRPWNDNGGGVLRLLVPPDAVEAAVSRTRRQPPRVWVRAVQSARMRAPGDDPPAAAARAAVTAHAYQWVPMLAMLSGRSRRVLLADDVGMGKSVQAGLLLAEVHDRMASARSLTVVPASLLGQWQDELEQRFGLQANLLDSETLAARTTKDPDEPAQPGELCLISLDTLRLPEVTALLDRCTWELLVVDEAHLLVPGSARRDAVSRIAGRASRVLLLTATPFTGHAAHDRQLLSVGRHVGEPDRMLVVTRGSETLQRRPVKRRVTWVPVSPAEARLHERLGTYVSRAKCETSEDDAGLLAALLLQRRACSSLHALAASVRRRLDVLGSTCPIVDEQYSLAFDDENEANDAWLRRPSWRDVDAERGFLRALLLDLPARDETGAKGRWLVRWLRRCSEPVLVFTEYVDTLRALRGAVAPFRQVASIHGLQTSAQRQLALTQFCTGSADVLLATDAAAEGLNLHQRCRIVVHIDIPWSPRRLAQREGRLDRIGQVHQVRATLLAAHDTYDEQVLERLRDRQRLFASTHAGAHADLAVSASRRRTQVAVRAIEHCAIAATAARSALGDRLLHTYVTPRRWHRLGVKGAGSPSTPSDTKAMPDTLVFAQVSLLGVHPLVRTRHWMAVVTANADRVTNLDVGGLAYWPTTARFVRRVCRRSARLHAQDRLAREAVRARYLDMFGVDSHSAPGTATVPAGSRTRSSPPSVDSDVRLHLLSLHVLSWRR